MFFAGATCDHFVERWLKAKLKLATDVREITKSRMEGFLAEWSMLDVYGDGSYPFGKTFALNS